MLPHRAGVQIGSRPRTCSSPHRGSSTTPGSRWPVATPLRQRPCWLC